MADDKKSGALNAFFVQHGEKLALGIALLALAAYFVIAFPLSSEDPSLGQVEKGIKTLEDAAKTPHEGMTAPASQNWMATAVGPWNTVVTNARGADDAAGSIFTKAEGKAVKKEIIKKIPVILPQVTFGSVDVAIDSITISWVYKDFTNPEASKLTKEGKQVAKVTHFTLERDVNGAGKWETLADKLDAKVQTYVDHKIEPKTKYAYRVTAYTTDKNYLERGGAVEEETGATPNPSGKGSVALSPSIQTLGIWKLTFTNAMKKEDQKGMVYVKIEKFEKGYGKVEKAHMQYDGDQIGFWEETGGAEPSSKHRVATKGGKSIEVDFNMGAVLQSVQQVKLVVDVKKCKAIYDKSTGNKTGCDQIVEKRNFETYQITYKDDEGVHKVHVPSPQSLDQLCEEHGGRKIITTLPPDAPAADPNAPKVDPKEAMKAKKEAEAEKLFEDAEKAQEKNKTLAISYYEKLLGEYKDTDFVARNKKSVIEERLVALKKKK